MNTNAFTILNTPNVSLINLDMPKAPGKIKVDFEKTNYSNYDANSKSSVIDIINIHQRISRYLLDLMFRLVSVEVAWCPRADTFQIGKRLCMHLTHLAAAAAFMLVSC